MFNISTHTHTNTQPDNNISALAQIQKRLSAIPEGEKAVQLAFSGGVNENILSFTEQLSNVLALAFVWKLAPTVKSKLITFHNLSTMFCILLLFH